MIDDAANRGYDDGGEFAEDCPGDVSEEAKEQVNRFLRAWLRIYCAPSFYAVENERPYVLTAADFAGRQSMTGNTTYKAAGHKWPECRLLLTHGDDQGIDVSPRPENSVILRTLTRCIATEVRGLRRKTRTRLVPISHEPSGLVLAIASWIREALNHITPIHLDRHCAAPSSFVWKSCTGSATARALTVVILVADRKIEQDQIAARGREPTSPGTAIPSVEGYNHDRRHHVPDRRRRPGLPIPVSAIATAAEFILPNLLHIDPHLCVRPVEVTDDRMWAGEVVNTLREEAENGSTRITKTFDAAFLHALTYGAEGIEVEEVPRDA